MSGLPQMNFGKNQGKFVTFYGMIEKFIEEYYKRMIELDGSRMGQEELSYLL